MVNLQSAENALKSFYLDAVKDSLNMKTNPFLAKIEPSTSNVFGKDVKKLVRIGLNGGVISGSETGDLPKSDKRNCLQLTGTLKNLYGTIEISDKAMRASMSNEGAFVNLLNDEMEGLLNSAKYNFGRMIMGDGSGELARVYRIEGERFFIDNVCAIQVGMRVRLLDDEHIPCEDNAVRTVEFIDRLNQYVLLSGDPVDVSFLGYIAIESDEDELTGLKALFDKKNIYGLSEEDYKKISPKEFDIDDVFSEEKLMTLLDTIEQEVNAAPNLIICSFGVRRAIVHYYKERGVALPSVEIEGGFKALSFNGIPIIADRFCDTGTLYAVNTNDFKLYQLCDWQWLENEDGKVLHQIPGKPVYTATLVKYAELICENPAAQGRMINIEEV